MQRCFLGIKSDYLWDIHLRTKYNGCPSVVLKETKIKLTESTTLGVCYLLFLKHKCHTKPRANPSNRLQMRMSETFTCLSRYRKQQERHKVIRIHVEETINVSIHPKVDIFSCGSADWQPEHRCSHSLKHANTYFSHVFNICATSLWLQSLNISMHTHS